MEGAMRYLQMSHVVLKGLAWKRGDRDGVVGEKV